MWGRRWCVARVTSILLCKYKGDDVLIATRINTCLQLPLPGRFSPSQPSVSAFSRRQGKVWKQLQVCRHVPQKNMMRGKISQEWKISYKYATLPIEKQRVGFSFWWDNSNIGFNEAVRKMKRLAGRVFLKEKRALAVPLIDFTLQDVQPDRNLRRRCDAEQRSEGENAQEETAKLRNWQGRKINKLTRRGGCSARSLSRTIVVSSSWTSAVERQTNCKMM